MVQQVATAALVSAVPPTPTNSVQVLQLQTVGPTEQLFEGVPNSAALAAWPK